MTPQASGQRKTTLSVPTIVHVISTPSGFGGAERILSSLVDEGINRGWRQVVVNPFDLNAEDSALSRSLRGRVAYQTLGTRHLWELPSARRWLRNQLAEIEPNIIHAHLPHALALVAATPRPLGTRLILSQQHGDYLAWRGRRVRASVDRAATRKCDRIVACSEYVHRFLASDPKLAREKIITILNGWQGEVPEGAPKYSEPTVICVANFRPEKAHRILIESFRQVVLEVPNAQLLLVGSGPLEAELRRQVNDEGLGDRVRFAGAVDNVWPLLAQSHVFALTSRFEPLGIVVMEAMAASLPVIATRVGGIPEIVQEGITGHLIDKDDKTSLSRHVMSLLSSPGKREVMAAAAREAAEPLRSQKMLKRYFALYEDELLLCG